MTAHKLVAPLAVIVAAIAGTIFLIVSRPPLKPANLEYGIPYVTVTVANPGPVDMVVESQGTVSPRTVADLVPQVSGNVIWTSANLVAGGYFEANEPLLRIDNRDYSIALHLARAEVDRAEAALEFARFELRQLREIDQRGLISRGDVEVAKRAARMAEAELAAVAAKLELAEMNLERTEVRAPFDGMVWSERVDSGQFVSRGAPIASLFAVDYVEVRLPVADRQLAWLDPALERRGELDSAVAPTVTLTAEYAGKRRRWDGRVVRTEAEIDARSRMVYLVARIDAHGDARDPDRLPPPIGLFVQAEILGRPSGNVVPVPRSAVRNGNQVLVVDDDKRLRFRTVEIVRIHGDKAYIGAGLDSGDRVSVSAMQAVVDGMRVEILDDLDSRGSGL